MEFNIRLLNESDYDETLVKWWKDWRWQAPLKRYYLIMELEGL